MESFEVIYPSDTRYSLTRSEKFVGHATNTKEYYAMMIACLIDSKQRYKEEGNHEWEYRCEIRLQYYNSLLYGNGPTQPREHVRHYRKNSPLTPEQKVFILENWQWYSEKQLSDSLGIPLKQLKEFKNNHCYKRK